MLAGGVRAGTLFVLARASTVHFHMHTVATLEPHQRRAFSAGFFCEVLANEYAVLLIHGPENPIGSLTQVRVVSPESVFVPHPPQAMYFV